MIKCFWLKLDFKFSCDFEPVPSESIIENFVEKESFKQESYEMPTVAKKY